MPYELYVALRYLFARRKQAFISVISLVSMLGVTVGVMALVIALALMTGLQQGVRDRMLGSSAHVYVFKTGGIPDYRAEVARLRQVPDVLGAAPALMGKALVSHGDQQAFITIKGIDPALEPDVTEIAAAITGGRFEDLDRRRRRRLPGILLGHELAGQLGAFVGDTVSVLTPNGTLSPMGVMPRQRRLKVVGIFQLGLFEFDQAFGYVTLETAGRLRRQDRARPHRAAGPRHLRGAGDRRRHHPAARAGYLARTGPTSTGRCSRRCGSRRWRSRSPSASS